MKAMSDTSNGRPWQLDDANWLDRRYRQAGDRTIAKELGVARVTVIRARERLGITSKRVGPRRGTTTPTRNLAIAPQGDLTLNGSLAALVARFSEDQAHRAPATRELVIARCQGWLEAEKHHDALATEDAILAAASALLLLHQHQITLRKAV
jgi:hypothetical protein